MLLRAITNIVLISQQFEQRTHNFNI